MAKLFDQMKSELLEIIECIICHECVDDARICIHCSQHFCHKCISHWLTTESTCPKCRLTLECSQLIKGNAINQIQESLNQLRSTASSFFCDKHKNEPLFCLHCEVNVCCWRSLEEHKMHIERIGSLEEAFEYYKQVSKTSISWIKDRKAEIARLQIRVEENGRRLNEELEQSEKTWEALSDAEQNPTALMKFVEAGQTVRKLRLQHPDKTELIQVDRLSDFVLEPTVLTFHVDHGTQTLKEQCFYQDASFGSKWKCTIERFNSLTADKEEKEEHELSPQSLFVHLRLVQGKPGAYSVIFENTVEKVHRFELLKTVKIGILKPVAQVGDKTQKLTIEVRQSYGDKILQMQEHIARLEKDIQKASPGNGIGSTPGSAFDQPQTPYTKYVIAQQVTTPNMSLRGSHSNVSVVGLTKNPSNLKGVKGFPFPKTISVRGVSSTGTIAGLGSGRNSATTEGAQNVFTFGQRMAGTTTDTTSSTAAKLQDIAQKRRTLH